VLAPLAVLTPGIQEEDLPALRGALEQARLPRAKRGELLAITYFIGVQQFATDLLQSFRRAGAMLNSPTYRLVVEESEARGEARGEARARAEALVKLVRHRLGRVPRGLEGKLQRMDAKALGGLYDQVLEAEAPQELRALLSSLPRR
jgi:hypothetical protein